MNNADNLKNNSDSLIGLLTAQCADLEKLLALAREETEAAQQGKFFKILDIVSERAEIAQKLETFQQQISELRGCLNSTKPGTVQNNAVERVVELANLTIAQDNQTRLLLAASRDETAESLRNLEKGNLHSNAYLREERKGLSYSRNF
jgi:flagellar biosynthesis/type III secretory pathway chaperone